MIKFGTSGWRAVRGGEFTFSSVRIVVQAIAHYLKQRFPGRTITVVVNYDTRFLSERYANEAAKILSHNQIQVLLADRDAPAQAQALQIIKRKAQAGINFTASFNPPEYNGLKLNIETGAPALPSGTSREYLDEILEDNGIPIVEIHGYVDPYFGGITPSCSEQNLRELGRLIREKKCGLGIATDADGGRFGILDQNGGCIVQI